MPNIHAVLVLNAAWVAPTKGRKGPHDLIKGREERATGQSGLLATVAKSGATTVFANNLLSGHSRGIRVRKSS
jgi:hypothetical protein